VFGPPRAPNPRSPLPSLVFVRAGPEAAPDPGGPALPRSVHAARSAAPVLDVPCQPSDNSWFCSGVATFTGIRPVTVGPDQTDRASGQLVIALRARGQRSLVQAHPFAADRVQQLTGRADSEKRVVLGLALRTSTGGCASAHDVLPGVQRTFGCLLPSRKPRLINYMSYPADPAYCILTTRRRDPGSEPPTRSVSSELAAPTAGSFFG